MRRSDPIKHEKKRQEILEAARRCFLRDGFKSASISAICAEAGISPGHLYHYFAGKDALMEAIAAAYLAEFHAHVSEMVGEATIAASVIGEIERVRVTPAKGQLLLFELVAEASRNPKIAKILKRNSKSMRSLLADVIRKGQQRGEVDAGLDCEAAASVLLVLIDAPKLLRMRDATVDFRKSAHLLSTIVESFLAGGSKSTQCTK